MLHRRAFQGWQAEGHPNLRAEGGAESAHRTAEGGISRGDSSWPQRVCRQGLPLLRCEGGVWGVKHKKPCKEQKHRYFKAFALTGRIA